MRNTIANGPPFGALAANTLVYSSNASFTDRTASSPTPFYQPSYDKSDTYNPNIHDGLATALYPYDDLDWSVAMEKAIKDGTFIKIFTQSDFPPPSSLLDEGSQGESQRLPSTSVPFTNVDRYPLFPPLGAFESTTRSTSIADNLIASQPQPVYRPSPAESYSPPVSTPPYSPPHFSPTLVHRTPKRSEQRSQQDGDILQTAFTANSNRPDPDRRQCLDRILIAPFYLDGEIEPKQNTAVAKEILGPLTPNPSRSAKSSLSIYQIFLDGKVCLMCGETKDSATRAIRCVRKHLNHRPFICGGQRDGCGKCGAGYRYVLHPYWTRGNAFPRQYIDLTLF
jgi:hypothetical protein